MDLSRRQLLIAGIASAAAAGGVALVTLRPRTREMPIPISQFLREHDKSLLMALAQVLLAGALSEDEAQQTAQLQTVIERLDAACLLLYPRARDELRELFDLLDRLAGRLLLTGDALAVEQRDSAAREQILESWRQHFSALITSAYHGLHNLVLASFYGDPQHWHLLDYAGPPTVRVYPESV